jgi:hypothetical protein
MLRRILTSKFWLLGLLRWVPRVGARTRRRGYVDIRR